MPSRPAASACASLVAALLVLLVAPTAHAAWSGTPGKIAHLDRDTSDLALRVVTPRLGEVREETVMARTWRDPSQDGAPPPTAGFPSAPAWSPDGTRLAFAAAIDDVGIGNGASHTAIFVWTLATGELRRVTTPPAGVADPDGAEPDVGEVAADHSPAWTADGERIAFVRLQEAGKDSPRYADRGGEVFTVPAAGGAVQRLTRVDPEGMFTSLSSGGDPDGASRLVGYHLGAQTGPRLFEIPLDGGGPRSLLPSSQAGLLADFDVAPDGLRVEYLLADGGAWSLDAGSGFRSSLGALGSVRALRASPTGNGPLHVGVTTVPGHGERAGVVERRRPDPQADVWPEDPLDRWVSGFTDLGGPYAHGTPGRTLWDVQAQRLPIINIPGFAGSTIRCGADDVLWPPSATGNGRRLAQMTLAADGRTDTGCAGPTGDPDDPDGFVSSVFGAKEIYAPQERFIDRIAPGDRGWRFSWDWRKAPSESRARLDAFISRVLATPTAVAQGADRVVLYAHSYGGFLVRELLERAPERVARALTVGTPYLGVPKPFFFINFGIENPLGDLVDLDLVLPDAEARAFARSSAGAYHLIAQDAAPRWLTHAGAFQSVDGARRWYTQVGGANATLFDEARAWHARHDGFTTAQGTVDVRAVIGTGELTIDGIDVPADAPPAGTPMRAEIRVADGDITVPAVSAGQGPLGTHTPLGEPVHVQAVCRVRHMEMGGHPRITGAYEQYLLTGRLPRRTEGPCAPDGSVVHVAELDAPSATRTTSPSPRATADGALTPDEAAAEGRIQLIDMPRAPVLVLSDSRPVTLVLGGDGRRLALAVTRYVGGAAAGTSTYGELSGDVRLAASAGGQPVVSVGGTVVAPDGSAPPAPAGGAPPPPVPTPASPAPAGGDRPAAPRSRVRSVRLSRTTLTLRRRVVVRVRTSRARRVEVRVVRLRGRCRGALARCRGTRVRTLRASVRRSRARVVLARRAGRRTLARGRYRLEVVPVGADGRRGRTAVRQLRVR